MFARQSLVWLVAVSAAVRAAQAEDPYEIAWVRQLGTSGVDHAYGVSADGLGNVYVSGSASGSLVGPDGRDGAFLTKYDAAGNLLWTQQLGTKQFMTISYGVSADGLGNVYISGSTWGSLGGPRAGWEDAFVSKYDAAANLLWTRQLGTVNNDGSTAVSADGLGNVYISGITELSLGGPNAGKEDAFVSKYDAAGNFLWTRQLGTSDVDCSHGVSADSLGNVFICGWTYGSLGGPEAGDHDAFVSKYDAAGNLLWARQLGTSDIDEAHGVAADGLGNVYISGETWGSLEGPKVGLVPDAFVSKYDAAGSLLWTRQLGTSNWDESYGASADGLGNVYVSGRTRGSLGGANVGWGDAFVSKYDAVGNLLWTQQLGTSEEDRSLAVSADGLGNVYIAGYTEGSLGAPNAGWHDAFTAKLVVPEPGTAALALAGLLFAVLWWRKAFRAR